MKIKTKRKREATEKTKKRKKIQKRKKDAKKTREQKKRKTTFAAKLSAIDVHRLLKTYSSFRVADRKTECYALKYHILLVSMSKSLSAYIFVGTVIDLWLFYDIYDTSKAK